MNVQKNNITCDSICEIRLNCNKQYTEPNICSIPKTCLLWKNVYWWKAGISISMWVQYIPQFFILSHFTEFSVLTYQACFSPTPFARFFITCSPELLQNTSSSNQMERGFFFFFSLLESWSFSLVNVALYYILVFPIYLITVGEFSMCKPNTGIPQRKIFLCLWTLGYRD